MDETIEAGKWIIYPMKSLKEDISESVVELRFRLKNDYGEVRSFKKER
ncbi:MAG: hypothetical protein AABX07_03815 [Nanoarchaeota archaeon]